MNSATQTFVADVIADKLIHNWLFWLVFFSVSGVASFAASFLKGYGGKRGESLATKEDFANLKAQLETTTRLTEEIKAEVGHIEWRTREMFNTRRAKLEEFVQQIGTIRSAIDPWVSDMIVEGNYKPLDQECLNRLEMLARLYFPALLVSVLSHNEAWMSIIREALNAAQLLVQINAADTQARKAQVEKNRAVFLPLHQELIRKRADLERLAAAEMQSLIEFPEPLRRSADA